MNETISPRSDSATMISVALLAALSGSAGGIGIWALVVALGFPPDGGILGAIPRMVAYGMLGTVSAFLVVFPTLLLIARPISRKFYRWIIDHGVAATLISVMIGVLIGVIVAIAVSLPISLVSASLAVGATTGGFWIYFLRKLRQPLVAK